MPARPVDDGLRERNNEPDDNDSRTSERLRRRPADIFLRRLGAGRPVALDFACTSGLRSDRLQEAAGNPEGVLAAYDTYKRDFTPPGETVGTEALCAAQGLTFIPMVIETHSGGWSKAARQVLDGIAKNVAATTNEQTEVATLATAQRLATTLHRENARAVMRRLRDSSETAVVDAWPVDDPGIW